MLEAIATINEVKDGKFECTIRSTARRTGLEGRLCYFDTQDQRVLCRFGSVNTKNPMHDNDIFQPYIMERGRLPHFSGVVDVERTTLEELACLDMETLEIRNRRTNPPSGTDVHLITGEDMRRFGPERMYYATIGSLPGDPTIPVSLVNRHHGDEDGGYGEGRHTMVVGQNGSGKTMLAKAKIATTCVAHPRMGCFIPDTSGDLTDDRGFRKGDFEFSLHDLLIRGGRVPTVIDVGDVRLESHEAFSEIVTPLLKRWFSIDPGKANSLLSRLSDEQPLASMTLNAFLDFAIREVLSCYANKGGESKAQEMQRVLERGDVLRRYQGEWDRTVGDLFRRGRHTIPELLDRFLEGGEILILSMKERDEKYQRFVMIEIFKSLAQRVNRYFKIHGRMVNSLIVLDEAPRWVPQDGVDSLKMQIVDALRTTRKMGLGWVIISQRMSLIDKAVLSESHTKFFGRNLGVGADAKHLEDLLGREGVRTYKDLASYGGYNWLVSGQDVNLGNGTTFITMRMFGGNATEAIIRANPHIWRS